MERIKGLASELKAKFENLNALGVSQSVNIIPSFISDDKLSTERPEMFAMYVQFLQGLSNNPESVYRALAVYNQNYLRSDRVKKRISTISGLLKYLETATKNSKGCASDLVNKINKQLGTNVVTNNEVKFVDGCNTTPGGGGMIGGGDDEAGAGAYFRNKLQQLTALDEKKESLEASGEGNEEVNPAPVAPSGPPSGPPSGTAAAPAATPGLTKMDALKIEYQSEIDEILNHPTYKSSVKSINNYDRVIFISTTFVLRGLTLFLLDWGINSYFVDNFTKAFYMYIIIYTLLTLVIVLLANVNSTGGFSANFKLFFYYLNVDNNGPGRIIVHLVMQWLLLPIMFVIKTNNTDMNNALSYEEKRKVYRVISNLTMFFWALTSVIALRY